MGILGCIADFFSGYAELHSPEEVSREAEVFDLHERAHRPDGTAIAPGSWDEVTRIADLTIPEHAIQAIETCRAHVDRHGIYWICRPKHGNAVITTATIP